MSDKTTELLQKLQSGEITLQECQAQMKTEKAAGVMTYKVSPKGAISFYGTHRRFPITVYKEELDQLLACTKTPEFAEFMEENKENLAVKK